MRPDKLNPIPTMISSNELRIGNYLLFDQVPSIVTAINHDLNSVSNDQIANDKHTFVELTGGRISGIALTEEILASASFRNAGKISERMNKWKTDTSNFILYFNGEYAGLITSLPQSIPIYFLHQLQNLYFSLIGEELQIRALIIQSNTNAAMQEKGYSNPNSAI